MEDRSFAWKAAIFDAALASRALQERPDRLGPTLPQVALRQACERVRQGHADARRGRFSRNRQRARERLGQHGGGRLPAGLNGSDAHDASDEHSGAEVRAEHRPHLGAEQRTRAEDLGALCDQLLGVLG